MPKTYYKSIGDTVEGFSFTFPNTKKKHKRYNNSKRRFNKHKTRARRNRKRSNTRNFFS